MTRAATPTAQSLQVPQERIMHMYNDHGSSTQFAAQTLPETASSSTGPSDSASENAQPVQDSRYEEHCLIQNLHPDPNQIGTYGDPGGLHDPTFEDLVASIEANGIREPLLASRGNGGVQDGTIISGHRRYAAALRLNLQSVPVRWISHRTADEATMARIDSNRQREKDLWVRGMELREEKEIEARRAKERQRQAGGARPGRRDSAPVTPSQGVGGRAPTVLEILAKREGHNKHAVALLQKLVELGCKDPNPSTSAVATALAKATWSDIGSIAAKFGLAPTKAPKGNATGTTKVETTGAVKASSLVTTPVVVGTAPPAAPPTATAPVGSSHKDGNGDLAQSSNGTTPETVRAAATTPVAAAVTASTRTSAGTVNDPQSGNHRTDAATPSSEGKPAAVLAPSKAGYVPLYSPPNFPKAPKPKKPFSLLLKILKETSRDVWAALDHGQLDEVPDEDFMREIFEGVRLCIGTLEECFPNEATFDWD